MYRDDGWNSGCDHGTSSTEVCFYCMGYYDDDDGNWFDDDDNPIDYEEIYWKMNK